MATNTATQFDSLASYAPNSSATTTTSQSGLADQSAQQNISASGNIDTLTKLLSGINQSAYLSAPGRQQQLGTIENQLSGNLDPSTVYQNQLSNAQQYGAGGFASDSPAWQTAIQRGLGIDRQNLITSGQNAMNSMYAGMPQVNAQDQTTTPALLEQQQATQSAQALQQQQIQNQAAQFAAQQAQQLSEFGTTSGQNAAQLYAQTFHSLPGYNQYGQYTGQTGTTPAQAKTSSATTPSFQPFNSAFAGSNYFTIP
jgi:hypothetical protein